MKVPAGRQTHIGSRLCFATLRYWAEVALLNDVSEEEIVEFFAETHPGDDIEVNLHEIGSCGQRIFVAVNHTTKVSAHV